MDLNLWTEDYLLPEEMGLDLLVDQHDGQYGDLKRFGHPDGDLKQSQPEDVVEQQFAFTDQTSLDDMNWMETDIGSFLDALATQQQELSSLPDFLDTSSLPSDNASQAYLDFLNDSLEHLPVRQDSMLTPPESPKQIQPVIKLEQTVKNDEHIPVCTSDSYSSNLSLPNGEIFTDVLGLNGIDLPTESKVETQESVDFIQSPLSADEVEIMLSSPEPASPPTPPSSHTSSLILSSPELFKVIASPSTLSNRCSPYSKQNSDKKSKSSKSSRTKKIKTEIFETDFNLDLVNLNKKDRKKLQNKNAAIRYRQKKKEEAKTVTSEVEGLEDTNQELKTKVEDLEREIRYMKNLMQEVQKAKGLL